MDEILLVSLCESAFAWDSYSRYLQPGQYLKKDRNCSRNAVRRVMRYPISIIRRLKAGRKDSSKWPRWPGSREIKKTQFSIICLRM